MLGLRAGLTLERAGSLYGITRERARQIAKQRGVIPTEVKRERKERAARIDTWKKDQIRALSRQHLGMTVDELAALAGLDAEVVRKCLGPRLPIHNGPVEGKVTSQFSDDDLLAFLSDFAANTEHVTIENYKTMLEPLLTAGGGQGFCVNLSCDTGSRDLMEFCSSLGALYIDTVNEPWLGFYFDKNMKNADRTNYALREGLLAEKRENPGGATAVSTWSEFRSTVPSATGLSLWRARAAVTPSWPDLPKPSFW